MRTLTVCFVLTLTTSLNAADTPIAPPVERSTIQIAPPVIQQTYLPYEDAYTLAMTLNKPLLVWVGDARCDRCSKETMNQFVHCRVESFEGSSKGRVIVSRRKGDELERVGEVTSWITGDPFWGHIPSSKRLLEGKPFVGPPQSQWAPVPAQQPIMFQQPMMTPVRFSSPAVCAS